MRLETKRLVLRDWESADIYPLIENINNLKVSQNLSVVVFPYAVKDAEWFIDHCKSNCAENPRKSYNFAIELRAEKKPIGGTGLAKVDLAVSSATLGYWLGEKYWRQGIMSEALKAVLKFFFEELKFNRIEAGAFVENPASARLLEKLGFVKEGFLRQSVGCKATGKVHDEFIYAMLKEDYLKAKNSWN